MNLRHKGTSIGRIAFANFESWLHTPKTAVLLSFLMALCFIEVRGTAVQLAALDARVYWHEMVFHQLAYGSNMLISTALFFSVMSEVPRRIAAQYLLLIRGGKARWLAGQMLYMLMLVLAFWLLLCAGTVLFSFDRLQSGLGWSDLSFMDDAFIPAMIRQQFSPFQAVLLASLPLLMFWYSILVTIFLFSLFHHPNLGVIFCAVNVYSVMTIGIIPMDEKWFVLSYATLNNIIGYDGAIIRIRSVLAGHLLYLTALVIVACIDLRHTDIEIGAR